ncbi:MAG TPA: ferrous iron transport protein A [Desulfotomaculum sp.]|nr:ferrous iron transport protein A [Desulfotomaculum sp.]
MVKEILLSELPIGRCGEVVSLRAKGMIRRRLLELGLVPETKIKTIRHSPLGDPTLFQFRGTLIALRREEARQVLVSLESL